ncbi:hypothetical protein COCON_G00147560 [Conger conger]|uniref:Uncharacterized protein n=1 Tax=Conger conger TaxID=82655 RepID=A0A9Q1DBX4_CONCO|nr:hypothetical protein COCON_G00147560 [Conger conger]
MNASFELDRQGNTKNKLMNKAYAVGVQCNDSADFSFSLLSTEITLHVSRSSVTVSRRSSLESCLLQFLHHFSQHGVSAQNRPRGEGLSALGTAVDTNMIILIPAALNTAHTVTVSTGNSHRILQDIQTD